MSHLRIELSDEEVEELGLEGLSMTKLNKVFRFLINPDDGEKKKQFHDQLDVEDYREYDDEGNVYVSRYCIAEEMGWGADTASTYWNVLRSNCENDEYPALDIYLKLLEAFEVGYEPRFWRVSMDKVAKSIISATEEYFFELSEEETNAIEDLVREIDWRKMVLRKKNDTYEYVMLDSFYGRMKHIEERYNEKPENWDVARQLIDKFKENI